MGYAIPAIAGLVLGVAAGLLAGLSARHSCRECGRRLVRRCPPGVGCRWNREAHIVEQAKQMDPHVWRQPWPRER